MAIHSPEDLQLRRVRRGKHDRITAGVLGVFVVGLALHVLDHQFRQPGGLGRLSAPLLVESLAAGESIVGLVFLRLVRHPAVPIAFTVVGISVAIALTVTHVLPEWGPLSDPYSRLGADWMSWAAMFAKLLGTIVTAFVGALLWASAGPFGFRARKASGA